MRLNSSMFDCISEICNDFKKLTFERTWDQRFDQTVDQFLKTLEIIFEIFVSETPRHLRLCSQRPEVDTKSLGDLNRRMPNT